MEEYLTVTVKVSKEDLKNYLENFGVIVEEEDLQSEATEAVQGILSDYFNDCFVYDKSCITLGLED